MKEEDRIGTADGHDLDNDDTQTRRDLKPCPFCGDETPILGPAVKTSNGRLPFARLVFCVRCRSMGPKAESLSPGKVLEQKAVALWNDRAVPS